MIRVDEDALICDLAETYRIYDYRSLPVKLAATLSVGLRDDSRIVMALNDSKVSYEKVMLAGLYDRLNQLVWSKTKDGAKNRNHPESVVAKLLNPVEKKEVVAFDSGKAFMEYRRKLIGGSGRNG